MKISITRPLLENNRVSQATFTSYRRFWLDHLLNHFSVEIYGTVVDLGGKQQKKRGNFRPPTEKVNCWLYINLELATQPDIYANVMAVPLPSESVDVVLCTEVLEHIHNPETCAREIWRILKPGGLAFVSVPFLYPLHADPYDFQRFTGDGLKQLFALFSNHEIIPMGGFWGTLGMLLDIGIFGISGNDIRNKILRRAFRWLAWRLYVLDLSRYPEENPFWQKFTTGYFLKAIK